MNYLLHNLGYDNPIDFRRIVLQAYKYRCAWLRDDQIDRLGLYDYTRWLPKVCYEQSNLEFAKKAYKKAKLELTALTNLRLKALYEEELKKYEVMHNSQNSYYADLAAKVITTESGCLCAIYEPHPFRSSAISEAVGACVDTGIADDEWAWTYYDWCCNPIGISYGKPDGIEVDKFTTDNLDFSWTTPECAQKMCDYLNMEPFGGNDD